ncbi:MAG TPA: AraC family transcriptional regulator [Thermoanaerobaculia bacterium]|nr:AraC family transcriptional regulator [Thermoanaerobaculia bacterium]
MNVSKTALYGRVVGSLGGEGARVAEHEYPAGFTAAPHVHEHTYLTIVLAGAVVERFGGRVEELRASSVQLMPAGEVHSNTYETETRCLHFEIDTIVESLVAAGGSVTPGSRRDLRAVVLSTLICDEFRRGDAAAPLAIEGLLHALLARPAAGLPRGSTGPIWLQRVIDAVHGSYSDRLSLQDLARLAGVHPAHLCREFHHRTGRTVGAYVRELRVAHACRRLSGSNVALAEIALECGFADQSHFTSTFRKAMGITPAQYRRLRSD